MALLGLSGRDLSPAKTSIRFREPLTRPNPSQEIAEIPTIAIEIPVTIRIVRVDFTSRAYLDDSVMVL